MSGPRSGEARGPHGSETRGPRAVRARGDVVRLPVACNRDCGGGCPLLATVEGGRVVRIADNPAGGAYLKGCVRGYQAWRQQQAPQRLTVPLVRTGQRGSGEFRETSWGEALARVAEGLTAVRERHGDGAVLALGGSGSCRGALHNTAELLPRFLNLIGGGVEESSTYSSAASAYVERVVLGTRKAGVDPATLRHSGMVVLWGANLVDCIMGCEWRARVREAKRRGGPVIVVDPRRNPTAGRLRREWRPVRPGTASASAPIATSARATNDHWMARRGGSARCRIIHPDGMLAAQKRTGRESCIDVCSCGETGSPRGCGPRVDPARRRRLTPRSTRQTPPQHPAQRIHRQRQQQHGEDQRCRTRLLKQRQRVVQLRAQPARADEAEDRRHADIDLPAIQTVGNPLRRGDRKSVV